MAAESKIEWTDSTFSPWIGCTKVSPACDHCYAEAQMATRMGRVEWGTGKPRSRTSAAYWKQPVYWNRRPFAECIKCGWRGEQPHILNNNGLQIGFSNICPACRDHKRGVGDLKPARRRVFCASLADVFDNEADPEWRADLFELIAATPNLDWPLLTKRIGNVAAMVAEAFDAVKRRFWIGQEYMRLAHRDVTSPEWTDPALPPNVWLGATVVNQQEADRDIPKLLAVPAAKRFLSIEPMLSEIDLRQLRVYNDGAARPTHDCLSGYSSDTPWGYVANNLVPPFGRGRIDWVICGGESGPQARPMHPDWVRSLRDQCAAAGVPFLFKQWGEWAPYRLHVNGDLGGDLRSGRVQHLHAPGNPDGFFRRGDSYVERVGKRVAGRQVDGREHLEWPTTGSTQQ